MQVEDEAESLRGHTPSARECRFPLPKGTLPLQGDTTDTMPTRAPRGVLLQRM